MPSGAGSIVIWVKVCGVPIDIRLEHVCTVTICIILVVPRLIICAAGHHRHRDHSVLFSLPLGH